MRRVIHARRGGRPPGVEDKGRKSRGGENRDVLHHLPTLPTSFHGYLRSSAGTIPDTEEEGRGEVLPFEEERPTHLSRHAPRAKTYDQRGPRCADLSPSWNDIHGFVKSRGMRHSTRVNFEGVSFLTVPISRDSFSRACGVEAGSKWMGFVGMTRFSSSFVFFRFEDSPVLGSFHRNENEVSIFNRINSFPPLCPSTPLRKQR